MFSLTHFMAPSQENAIAPLTIMANLRLPDKHTNFGESFIYSSPAVHSVVFLNNY